MPDQSSEKDLRLAVLIDADNASRTAMKDVMAEVAVYGTPTIKRIYGDWTTPNMASWKPILLENAIKYGRGGTSVRMALRKTDCQAVQTVDNEGDPIPAEQLSHLFERFYRADASRGEKSGFGLGLAIAKTIMDAHKGAIRAESSARETRFICTFPLKKG